MSVSLLALLRGRRSVRRFRPEAPPDAAIEALLEAAVTAPSASNKQPWRFVVVTDRALIARFAETVRAEVERLAALVPPESEAAFRAYGEYFTRFEHAPVVIVPACRGPALLSHLVGSAAPEDRAPLARMERDSALVGTSLAIQNLLLMAHELGLGASVMTGPLVAADGLRALLELPESWDLVALVPVGFSAEEPAPTERKPLNKVVRWIR